MAYTAKTALSYHLHQKKRHRKELKRRRIRRIKRLKELELRQSAFRSYRQGLSYKELRDPNVRRYIDSRVRDEVDFKLYTHVKAPGTFSLLNNTNGVLKFIKDLEVCLEKKRKTFVELSDVTEMHHDAIVVLLSIMRRFREEGIPFNGDFPQDDIARKVIEESSFFDKLYDSKLQRMHKYSNPSSSIHTRTNKKVDVELADRLIKESTKTVWGEAKRCTGIYRILIELMTNTHNHAEIGQKGSESWHLCVVHLEEEKKVVFTFVDYGVGVINSLQNKKPGEKMYGFLAAFKRLFTSLPTNAEIVREIFLDEKQVSSTGESHRGYGLPSLYSSFLEQEIVNLNYITNNVRVNGITGEFSALSENFSGTFIYWELNDTCDYLNTMP